MCHVDASFAFLHGHLNQEVIIAIRKGMNIDPTKYALRSDKSLYGLEVLPRNWNVKISGILKVKNYYLPDLPLIS